MVALRIAWRYLFSKKSHSAVNVISVISLAGVALASMAIVCIMSVFNGFTDLALSQASVLSPDLRIEPSEGKIIGGVDSLLVELRGISGVELVAPVVEERALAICGDKQMPVRITGVTDNYGMMSDIVRVVKEDGMFAMHDSILGDMATLSVGAALTLDARPTSLSRVAVYVPRRIGRINTTNPAMSFRADTLVVSGVYQTDQAETDADGMVIPISVARRLLEYEDEATALDVKISSGEPVGEVADRMKLLLGEGYTVKDRIAQQEESFRMISVEKWVTFCMMLALGASQYMVARIFMIEGWLISLIGGVIGVTVGGALCLIQQIFGIICLGGNHNLMTTDVYPVRLDGSDMLVVLALVAVVGFTTSSLTAMIARKRMLVDAGE